MSLVKFASAVVLGLVGISTAAAQQPQTVFPAQLPAPQGVIRPVPLPGVVQTAATAPATDAAPPTEELPDDELLAAISETMITTTLAYLNQANLSVGVLADAITSSAYDEEQAQRLLTAHLSLAKQVEAQLTAFTKAPGLDDDDLAAVSDLLKVAKIQTAQCATLQLLFDGEDVEANEKKWDELRANILKELEVYAAGEVPTEEAVEEKTE